MNKRTNVVFSCSTINRDSTYKLILEMLEKKKVNVMTYDNFFNGKENILTGSIEELNNDLEAKEQERIKKENDKLDPKPTMVLFPKEESVERKERKPKRLAPEYVFIFDDLGSDQDMHQLLNVLKRHATTKQK